MSGKGVQPSEHFDPCRLGLCDGRVVLLREAEPGDSDDLLAFVRATLPDTSPYLLVCEDEFEMTEADERDWIERQRAQPGSLALLMLSGDQVVGMMHCATRPGRRRVAHVGHLGMSIDRAYWGSGLGGHAMARLIAWAEAHPVLRLLELQVYADNERALRLYRGSGFVVAGTLPRRTRFDDGSTRDDLLMFRRVDGSLGDVARPGDFYEPIAEGVTLRQVRYGDADALYAIFQRDPERYRRYFRWAWKVQSAGSFRASAADWAEALVSDGVVTGVIEADGEVLGMAYIVHHAAQDKRCDLGYWLDPEHEGRGLVTRACQALIRYAFDTLGVNRVDIFADRDNRPSQRVAERLGFEREALIKRFMGFPDGRVSDLVNYRLLRERWH